MKKLFNLSALMLLFAAILKLSHIYYYQEERLFQPTILPDNHVFSYKEPFKEIFLETDHDSKINALHFYAKNPKGVILYFHGRGGDLSYNLGKFSKEFTRRGYDFFVMDYRGFGKSRGKLSEAAIYHDANYCYNHLLNYFPEEKIIVFGSSLGTGIATQVAAQNNPKALVLASPYFSILDLTPRQLPYVPRFLIPILLKYHFRTDQWIVNVKSPIYIFHGTADELIPHESSDRLHKLIKEKRDAFLISIENGTHNHLSNHPKYQINMDQILD